MPTLQVSGKKAMPSQWRSVLSFMRYNDFNGLLFVAITFKFHAGNLQRLVSLFATSAKPKASRNHFWHR